MFSISNLKNVIQESCKRETIEQGISEKIPVIKVNKSELK